MKAWNNVFIGFICLVLCACTEVQSDHSDHQHEHDTAIALNNGEKWEVEAKMMGFIRSMEQDVKTYSADDGLEDLRSKLKENIDSLTSNCTMTGQAHDELHKWLIPYIDLVNEMEDDMTELNASFETFNSYFK